MTLANISKREKSLGIIFIVTLSILLIHTLVAKPLANKWSVLNQSIEQAEQKLRKNNTIIDRRNQIQHQYNQLTSQYKNILPAKNTKPSNWLKIIEKAAGKNIQIHNINPKADENRKKYIIQSVEIECTGKLVDLTEFIYNILHTPHLLKISRLSFRAMSNEKNKLRCSIVISKIEFK